MKARLWREVWSSRNEDALKGKWAPRQACQKRWRHFWWGRCQVLLKPFVLTACPCAFSSLLTPSNSPSSLFFFEMRVNVRILLNAFRMCCSMRHLGAVWKSYAVQLWFCGSRMTSSHVTINRHILFAWVILSSWPSCPKALFCRVNLNLSTQFQVRFRLTMSRAAQEMSV